MADDVKKHLNISIPSHVTDKIDIMKAEFQNVYGREVSNHQFIGILAGTAMIILWVYTSIIPWRFRAFISIGISIWLKSYWPLIGAITFSIPRLWNLRADKHARISDKNSEMYFIAGSLLFALAFSGKVGFNWTIAAVGGGCFVMLMGCLQRAANHSIGGSYLTIQASAVIAVVIFSAAAIYYRHTVELWNTCGMFEGDKLETCKDTYLDTRFQDTLASIRRSPIPSPSKLSFLTLSESSIRVSPLIGLCATLAAIILPSIINVMGEKYKAAGVSAGLTHKKDKDGKVLEINNVKPYITISDMSLLGDSVPTALSYFGTLLYAFYDPVNALLIMFILITSQVLSYQWFVMYLSSDFVIEGTKVAQMTEKMVVENGITVIGNRGTNHLPQKTSMAVVTLLSIASAATGFSVLGIPGVLCSGIPILVFYYSAKNMSLTSLIMLSAACCATTCVPVALGGIGIALASTGSHTMKIHSSKSEEVATPVPSAK